MTAPAYPPPQPDIIALDAPGLISRYAKGVENFDRRVFDLSDDQLDTAFLPSANVGRWPCRVLLGHLADADLAQTHRIRRAAAEESPLLSVWDENAFIDSGLHKGPIGGYVAVIHTLRAWTAEWLRSIEPAVWTRRAMHPQRGPMTVRSMVEFTVWHLEHHAAYLNKKVEKFLGPSTTSR